MIECVHCTEESEFPIRMLLLPAAEIFALTYLARYVFEKKNIFRKKTYLARYVRTKKKYFANYVYEKNVSCFLQDTILTVRYFVKYFFLHLQIL